MSFRFFCSLAGKSAMPKPVNLDALIRRADLEAHADLAPTKTELTGIKLSELEHGSMLFSTLRKPDFQRETANWTPEKVASLVKNFVDEDLIPAVIIWRSPITGDYFVIDGAHRLSALIAYVNNDYGDRGISTSFFQNRLTPDQRTAARQTRDLIDKTVGPYDVLKNMSKSDDANADQLQLKRAKQLPWHSIVVQMVNGDASKAEASFYTINQSATAIDDTELEIIKARHKPNAIAARAVIRAGTGHKYWKFDQHIRDEIEYLANSIYNLLFDPPFKDPVKTLDLPVSPESLRMAFEFINNVNELKPEMWIVKNTSKTTKKSKKKTTPGDVETISILSDDKDGQQTIKCLKEAARVLSIMSGTADIERSLALHPAVYFYSATGRIQPTAVMAAAKLVQKLGSKHNGFHEFTKYRNRFEEFLVKYRYFVNQIARGFGAGKRGLGPLLELYDIILGGIKDGQSDDDIVNLRILKNERFRKLKVQDDDDRSVGDSFSKETKSATFLKPALASALRCAECGARVYFKGIQIDHKLGKASGGDSSPDNAQLMHPFCNTGFKQRRLHLEASEQN